MFAGPEDAAAAVLQADLHLTGQDEHPLLARSGDSRACGLPSLSTSVCWPKRARPSAPVRSATWVNVATSGAVAEVMAVVRTAAVVNRKHHRGRYRAATGPLSDRCRAVVELVASDTSQHAAKTAVPFFNTTTTPLSAP
jgi:hypothetical protein